MLVALPEEARAILRGGAWDPDPRSADRPVYRSRDGDAVLAVIGMGRAAVETVGRRLLADLRPAAVLGAGFAGGLLPGLPPGRLVIARRVGPGGFAPTVRGGEAPRADPPGEWLRADPALLEAAERALAASGLPHAAGDTLTADGPITRAEDKQRMGLAIGGLAVDMESYWLASLCRETRTPFLSVRAIVDTADEALPPFAPDLASLGGVGRAARVLLHPWWLPRLARLAVETAAAGRSLAAFVAAFERIASRAADGAAQGRQP